MSPETDELRSQPGVTASIIAAALGFALFCGVAIAVLVGWIGPGPSPAAPAPRPVAAPSPAAPVAPAPKAARLAVGWGDLGLEAGESVVQAPAPPAALPDRRALKRHRNPAQGGATPGRAPARSPRPTTPSYARVPHPTDPDDDWPRSLQRR